METGHPSPSKIMDYMKPQITLIVPMYNGAKYIEQAITSIKGQIFEDFEALIVDDGSKDNGALLCKALIVDDSRFKLLRKENGGVSSARNYGLDNATGRWIVFMDIDDTIGEDYLQKLYENRRENGVGVGGFYETQNGVTSVSVDFPKSEYIKEQISDVLSHKLYFHHPSPFAKIFDSTIIREGYIRFDTEINFAEDLLFFTEYLCYADCVNSFGLVSYNYLKENSSLSVKPHKFNSDYKLCIGYIDAISKAYKRIGKYTCDIVKGFEAILAMNALTALRNEPMSKNERYKTVKRVRSQLAGIIKNNYNAPTRVLRLKKTLFLYFPWLYSRLI